MRKSLPSFLYLSEVINTVPDIKIFLERVPGTMEESRLSYNKVDSKVSEESLF